MEERRNKRIVAGLGWVSVALAAGAVAQTPLPSHGPAKGYLVITGGGPDDPRMIALAGESVNTSRLIRTDLSRWTDLF